LCLSGENFIVNNIPVTINHHLNRFKRNERKNRPIPQSKQKFNVLSNWLLCRLHWELKYTMKIDTYDNVIHFILSLEKGIDCVFLGFYSKSANVSNTSTNHQNWISSISSYNSLQQENTIWLCDWSLQVLSLSLLSLSLSLSS
jgi:hypothetical protein